MTELDFSLVDEQSKRRRPERRPAEVSLCHEALKASVTDELETYLLERALDLAFARVS